MDLNLIRKALEEHLNEKGLHLYDLKFTKGDSILHVELDDQLDLNGVETASRDISDFMDEFEDQFDEYMLDVYTVGAERPIKTEEEINKAVGSYVYLKGKELKLYGTLVSYADGIMTISYKEKNISKTRNVDRKDVKEMRYAIEF